MSEVYRNAVDALQHRAAHITAVGLSAFTLYASEAVVNTSVAIADTCTTEQTAPDTTTKTCYDDAGNVALVETSITTSDEVEEAPTSEPVSTAPGRSESGESRVKRHRFRSYNQGDWVRPSTACGPTSLAMVIGTLKNSDRINPNVMTRQIPKKWYWPGSGTDSKAFFHVGRKYGVKVKNGNLADAKEVIEDGGLAIVHAKPGHFTARGHYMVLRAVRGNKFRIADPNRGGRNGDSETRLWGPRELRAKGIDDVWTFENR